MYSLHSHAPSDDGTKASASYILGLAASAFNFWYIEALSNGTLAHFSKRSNVAEHSLGKRADFPAATVNSLLDAFQQYFNLTKQQSVSPIIPNPYAGMPGTNGPEPATLSLADGSEGGQAVPFWPMLQPARNVDFMWVTSPITEAEVRN